MNTVWKMVFVLSLVIGLLFWSQLGFSAEVTGNNNNVNICQPKVIIKSGCCNNSCPLKPKVVTKIVEKIVTVDKPHIQIVERQVEKIVEKRITHKNHVSLLLGYGARGNLVETRTDDGRDEFKTENGAVAGIQYLREVKQYSNSSLDLLIQAQTNRTLSIGIGLGF